MVNLAGIGGVFLLITALTTMGVAHTGHTSHDTAQEQPLNDTQQGPIPDLPSDASPTAQRVVDTINAAWQNGISFITDVGTRLQNLLTGGGEVSG